MIDIWGLGILSYEFVVGRPPFESDSKNETYERIEKLKYEFPDYVSTEFKDFVK